MHKYQYLLFILCYFCSSCAHVKESSQSDQGVAVFPIPYDVKTYEGRFELNAETTFIARDQVSMRAAKKYAKDLLGLSSIEIASTISDSKAVELITEPKIKAEGYRLECNGSGIKVHAADYNGFIYALQTLKQLSFTTSTSFSGLPISIPFLTIEDHPRYQWRGLMLDVSRHFFEKEYILKTIERMAFFKLNTLHLHLIDDQGWRLEIKKFPKLTEIGACRVDQEDKHWDARLPNPSNAKGDLCGYFTQDDIKEIVAYAHEFGITVVPEIEMPAHVTSAIASYPELSCKGVQVAVPSGGLWPITDIYCPGKERTFEFLEDVMIEVMDLFDSRYIHVGGDEATKTNWETCQYCRKRMASEGLDNTEELQSYFIRRMEKFLSNNDRILIGWDEILEGGLASGATVMSWRGYKGGIEASEMGHDVVMTPGDFVYFNQYQGDPDNEPLAFGGYVPLKKVYHFDPVLDTFSEEQRQHILGAQANLWSEFITDESLSEYMLFPRLPALSEALWSSKENKDWARFSSQIPVLFSMLESMDINYSNSSYDVTAYSKYDMEDRVLEVALGNEFPSSEIRYTIDGSEITGSSTVYTEPIEIDQSTKIKAMVYESSKLIGDPLEKEYNFHLGVGREISFDPPCHSSYQGKGDVTLVNVIRGSKNFHDKQWLAWLVDDVEIIIDLGVETKVTSVSIGAMENQGSGIYFPTRLEVLTSIDGSRYESVGAIDRPFANNGFSTLQDFRLNLQHQSARWIKVKATNLGHPPKGGDAWMFLDEIIIE